MGLLGMLGAGLKGGSAGAQSHFNKVNEQLKMEAQQAFQRALAKENRDAEVEIENSRYLRNKADDEAKLVEGRNYQEEQDKLKHDQLLQDDIIKRDRDFEYTTKLEKWKLDNTQKDNDVWLDVVDEQGNIVNQRNQKTGALKWSARERGNGTGSSKDKTPKDNIIDLPIDVGNDIKIKYNETRGEYLDPTGALLRPRATREEVLEEAKAVISDINSVNGSDAEFAEYFAGATDKLGNPIKTEKQALDYVVDQMLDQSSLAAQFNIPANKIVKQWSKDEPSPTEAIFSGEGEPQSTIKIGNVTVPQPNAQPQTEKPQGMLEEAQSAQGQPVAEPTAEPAQEQGMLAEVEQRKSDLALLEANGIKVEAEDKKADKTKRGYFELTAEDGSFYNPAEEAFNEIITQPRDSYNAYLGAAKDAANAVEGHFDKLSEAKKQRAIETAKRAIDNLRKGKPLNKLEVKAIKEVPQESPEDQAIIDAWLRLKGL